MMKNFVGKMLNIVGIVGLVLINCFVCIFFFLTLATGKTILGDFSDLKLNATKSYYLLPIISFCVYIVFLIIFIIIDFRCLVSNQIIKLTFIFSIIFMLYSIMICFVIVQQRYVQGFENPGVDLMFIYWCGGIAIFFSALIMVGNALKLRRS